MHTRRNFPNPIKREAFERSNGICECHLLAARRIPGFSIEGCGQKLSGGNTFYEHIDCDALWGMNDLGNCAVLVKTCWKLKTASFDLPTIAANNRQRDSARGIRSRSTMPGSRDSNVKLRINASPIDRNTGRPLFERRR